MLVDSDKGRPAIERSRRPCLQELAVVNPALGCSTGCLFCGLSPAPENLGRVLVKDDLPEMLADELDNWRPSRPLPRAFVFDTATDSFQRAEGLSDVVFEAMRLVLERGFHLYFVTRGRVPDGFSRLFKRFPGKVHGQVSFFTMDEALSALYEPCAFTPQERLEGVRKLVEWGVDVRGRLDPIIPLVADTAGHFEDLLRFLRSAGITRVTANYLVLRPHLLEIFERKLPPSHFELIRGSFKGQAWLKVGLKRMTKLLPSRIRVRGYERLERVAERAGIQIEICSCDNPESSSQCFRDHVRQESRESQPPGQLDLFRTG